jgi:hypothetical protein
VLAVIHDQFKGASAEFVGEAAPIAIHTVPGANCANSPADARMPIEDGAAGIEAKRLDVVYAHDVIIPFDSRAVRRCVAIVRSNRIGSLRLLLVRNCRA